MITIYGIPSKNHNLFRGKYWGCGHYNPICSPCHMFEPGIIRTGNCWHEKGPYLLPTRPTLTQWELSHSVMAWNAPQGWKWEGWTFLPLPLRWGGCCIGLGSPGIISLEHLSPSLAASTSLYRLLIRSTAMSDVIVVAAKARCSEGVPS